MGYKYILVDKAEGIATITLNRPDKFNSLIPPMRVELREAFEDVDRDKAVRAVILTGAGKGFCSGADVVTVAEGTEKAEDEPERVLLMKPVQSERVLEALRNINKPTICALNGIVAGAGIGYALYCDIIIASELARFRIAFTRIGTRPGVGTALILQRRIGTHRALELIYTNDIIDAKEMDRIGLVNRVVPHDQLLKIAHDMAKKVFQMPPITLALSKKSMYHTMAPDLESQMVFDDVAARVLAETEDQKEAQRSLIEKRPPVYKGK